MDYVVVSLLSVAAGAYLEHAVGPIAAVVNAYNKLKKPPQV